MRKTLDEIKLSFKEIIGDGISSDEAISFLEDLEDSFEPSAGVDEEEVNRRIAEAVEEVANEWREKYVSRFFNGENSEEKEEPEKSEEEKEEERAEEIQIDDLFEEKGE